MKPVTVVVLVCLGATLPAAAQEQAAETGAVPHDMAVPRVAATPLTTAIRVDGLLDEAAWDRAAPTTEFTQLDPLEGEPASQRTEIRFLYDDAALYIGGAAARQR